jgi:hypothetical protein
MTRHTGIIFDSVSVYKTPKRLKGSMVKGGTLFYGLF